MYYAKNNHIKLEHYRAFDDPLSLNGQKKSIRLRDDKKHCRKINWKYDTKI